MVGPFPGVPGASWRVGLLRGRRRWGGDFASRCRFGALLGLRGGLRRSAAHLRGGSLGEGVLWVECKSLPPRVMFVLCTLA
jgi:hypothetical protein